VADPPKFDKKSRYTEGRGFAGAYEGETVTRRRLMEGGAQLAGGVAVAMIALPGLGFALGPLFEDTTPTRWQDVGPEDDFNDQTYVPKVISIVPQVGDAGKTTIYVRTFNPKRDKVVEGEDTQPYVAISTRCAHLGCPVRFVEAANNFICPCHGGVYDFQGKVIGGPPVRPLDHFQTRVRNGEVQVGPRYSVTSQLDPVRARDPGEFTGGVWNVIYPPRPDTFPAP
jgi:quinol---cytochrome c reductase iron-sulfur subunit, bacillus type